MLKSGEPMIFFGSVEPSAWKTTHHRNMIPLKAQFLGKFRNIDHLLGTSITMPLLNQREVNTRLRISGSKVGSSQFRSHGIQGSHRKHSKKVLKFMSVRMVGLPPCVAKSDNLTLPA